MQRPQGTANSILPPHPRTMWRKGAPSFASLVWLVNQCLIPPAREVLEGEERGGGGSGTENLCAKNGPTRFSLWEIAFGYFGLEDEEVQGG